MGLCRNFDPAQSFDATFCDFVTTRKTIGLCRCDGIRREIGCRVRKVSREGVLELLALVSLGGLGPYPNTTRNDVEAAEQGRETER